MSIPVGPQVGRGAVVADSAIINGPLAPSRLYGSRHSRAATLSGTYLHPAWLCRKRAGARARGGCVGWIARAAPLDTPPPGHTGNPGRPRRAPGIRGDRYRREGDPGTRRAGGATPVEAGWPPWRATKLRAVRRSASPARHAHGGGPGGSLPARRDPPPGNGARRPGRAHCGAVPGRAGHARRDATDRAVHRARARAGAAALRRRLPSGSRPPGVGGARLGAHNPPGQASSRDMTDGAAQRALRAPPTARTSIGG